MSDARSSQARLRALVVDDDAVIRITIEDCLDEADFEVIEAHDGEAGLAAFHDNHPDIVLLDVMMPRLDGFGLCERIRSCAAGKYLPVLMMTGGDDIDSVSRAFQVGATDFITKPINADLLIHRIRYMLRAKRTADLLRKREQSLANAQRIARLGNWERGLTHGAFSCSEVLRELVGFVDETPRWEHFVERIHPDSRARVLEALEDSVAMDSGCELEFSLVRCDGSELIVRQDIALVTDSDTGERSMLGTVQDVTVARNAEARIRELAYYDSVTGLPNRTMLHEHLRQAVASAMRHGRVLAVLFIDLDHFKRINDTWGHSVGDDVLRTVARRLIECLRSCDVTMRLAGNDTGEGSDVSAVARLGGDEFVVVLPELRRAEDAAAVARRVNESLCRPFDVRGTEVYVSGSIGVSVFPDDGSDADSLLQQADSAMYEVKAAGRNDHRFFTKEIQGRAFARLSLEARLRRALERDEFVLHYQPKLELCTNRIVGMEALVRWNNTEFGLVSPAEFIPIAEETGLIVDIGRWVMNEACAQTQAWKDDGLAELCVSVNLSVVQTQDRALPATVIKALELSALEASSLELELTEGLLMHDTQSNIQLLNRLKEIGVRLSVDDFGTGYSSLRYLKILPIDALKIDRCFISELDNDDDAAIIKGTIGLAHSLRLKVVAEGVEDATQLERLTQLGCDEIQGYYCSRPLPARDFERWLTAERARHEPAAVSILSLAGTSR